MPQMTQVLRADARDNRDRVLAAARSLFAERGLDVTMRQVARAAAVGPATLYRRFPTKQDLVDAAFADEVRACRAIVEQGCADPDPWRGFCSVVERVSVLNVRNQGFVDAFASAHPDVGPFTAHRAAAVRLLAGLADRAKAAGRLRADFVVDDLVLVLLANRGLASAPPDVREAAARRFAALALDGFSAPGVSPLPRAPRLVGRDARTPTGLGPGPRT
ncbi:TetR/AcrR family transcriptional regulator [Microlunatus flavus]|uniref:DNA-binding transcriptional regulator, AcrR family n=1 Tax=Microlunatus flavus TaxID=1036181 RepID=A0A1H9CG26_9ACTN|nr:TetR/AcrR family transcriptional regulator [Microlunatus flavus]SEQ00112.1 DNA-binding transcriptional regulator, AcrR family [Microlunatus flavus]